VRGEAAASGQTGPDPTPIVPDPGPDPAALLAEQLAAALEAERQARAEVAADQTEQGRTLEALGRSEAARTGLAEERDSLVVERDFLKERVEAAERAAA
jgi:hypothetical protein